LATRIRPRSVVLTDWAADTDNLRVDRSGLIHQLLLLSLLYDEILVQDELLVLSDPLASWFSSKEGLSLWDELLDVGSLVILRHPQTAYPNDELRELSFRHPIEARAKYIETYGTKNDRRFRASDAHWKFYSHLEWCLANDSGRMRETGSRGRFDIMPVFSNTLVTTLTDPSYLPWLQACFPKLNVNDIARFRDFVSDPSTLVAALEKAGLAKSVLRSERIPVLNRSLAYQATDLFPPAKRPELRQLIQSSFAAPFCWRENAIGRYGGMLRTIPTSQTVRSTQASALVPSVQVQAHVNVPLAMPGIERGFASIIAEVRDTKAGKELRDAVARLAHSKSFDVQKNCWTAVAHELARRVAKPQSIGVSIDKMGQKIAEGVTIGAVVHTVTDGFAGKIDFLPALMAGAAAGAIHGIGAIIYDGLHQVWSTSVANARIHELSFQFENAVDFRCTWIPEPDKLSASPMPTKPNLPSQRTRRKRRAAEG